MDKVPGTLFGAREISAWWLRNARIAHGDLHHGNIYVTKNGLRLLDYDGAYVPALEGLSSNELGHPNYQHPRRTQSHFSPDLDNFSAWVIYTSLFCLNIDGTLWHKLAGGDECLLFRSSDFGDPANSYTFSLLENHASIEIRHAAGTLRELCGRAPNEIPYLGEPLHQSTLGPLKTSPILPSWLTRGQEDDDAGEPDDSYPTFRDFNEAMKAPEQNFSDPELKQGVCILEDTRVGRNGRVYRFRCPDRNVAVKVFSRDDPQREDRYRALERAVGTVASQYLIDFDFIARGVNIHGYWLPIVKMEWLNGTPVHQLPAAIMSDGLASYLADQFATMMKTFKGAGIAHGDLELNNLLVCGQDLKVVDYDAMFVPELFRLGSPELGNPGYQHSKRKKTDYAPYVDNFAAWLIHYLLKNLNARPKLYELSEACLNEEHRGTTDHATLRALERHPEPVVAKLGGLLQIMLSRGLPLIPDLHPEQSLETIVSQDTRTVSSPGGLLKRKKPQI